MTPNIDNVCLLLSGSRVWLFTLAFHPPICCTLAELARLAFCLDWTWDRQETRSKRLVTGFALSAFFFLIIPALCRISACCLSRSSQEAWVKIYRTLYTVKSEWCNVSSCCKYDEEIFAFWDQIFRKNRKKTGNNLFFYFVKNHQDIHLFWLDLLFQLPFILLCK